MKLEGYKSGIYSKVDNYKAFILSGINYNWSWEEPRINKLLSEASRLLGKIDVYFKLMPNIDTYIKMFEKFEAYSSCKIAGIDDNIEDYLGGKDTKDSKKIENCFLAINYGKDKINEGAKITTNLLCDMNKVLLQGSEEQNAGRLRTTQVWIGDTDIASAEFVPPPPTEIIECLTDFEKFIQNDDTDTPDLVKISMLHYQLETIHPFYEGNRKDSEGF